MIAFRFAALWLGPVLLLGVAHRNLHAAPKQIRQSDTQIVRAGTNRGESHRLGLEPGLPEHGDRFRRTGHP